MKMKQWIKWAEAQGKTEEDIHRYFVFDMVSCLSDISGAEMMHIFLESRDEDGNYSIQVNKKDNIEYLETLPRQDIKEFKQYMLSYWFD